MTILFIAAKVDKRQSRFLFHSGVKVLSVDQNVLFIDRRFRNRGTSVTFGPEIL